MLRDYVIDKPVVVLTTVIGYPRKNLSWIRS